MFNACVLLKIVPTKATSILNSVQNLTGVRKSFFSYGRFDLVAFLEVNDYKALRAVTDQINSFEGVRSTETLAEA
jgi:uncharacterized protein with GYD domain